MCASSDVEPRDYWDKKFAGDSLPWGLSPSAGAAAVARLLGGRRRAGMRLLDLGCGYGRDSRLFAERGHRVVGVDISPQAVQKASKFVPNALFRVMDVRELAFADASFDAVFANFLVHLFTEFADRLRTISETRRVLCPGGIAVFTVASTDDADCGKGDQIGRGVYRNERGVAKFYYAASDVDAEFCGFDELRAEPLVEHHVHDGPHTHASWLVSARKRE